MFYNFSYIYIGQSCSNKSVISFLNDKLPRRGNSFLSFPFLPPLTPRQHPTQPPTLGHRPTLVGGGRGVTFSTKAPSPLSDTFVHCPREGEEPIRSAKPTRASDQPSLTNNGFLPPSSAALLLVPLSLFRTSGLSCAAFGMGRYRPRTCSGAQMASSERKES